MVIAEVLACHKAFIMSQVITAALYIISMESRVIMAWLSFCEFGENKMVYIIYY